MVRKAVDSRINTLIKNGVTQNHRSFFVLVGDKGKDQIVNLHWMLTQARVGGRPSVLWCYKKELGFTSHRKKRENKIKRDVKRGIREANSEDPFEMFVTVTDIRYTYYKETHKVLGNTYGMCVLQDFEALTPNILARTIETVEGGGLVVVLLKSMRSLRQLYTMTMDVHARYRGSNVHGDVVGRFNERFMLSLADNSACLVVDDELNVLPVSLGKSVKPLGKAKAEAAEKKGGALAELKQAMADTPPVGALVGCARTADQARAIMTFADAIAEKSLRGTVSLTAARGRGKSAALGLSLAAAIAYGYSNIFVTSPSAENLKTLFQFVFRGFDALGFTEHADYDIVQSTSPELRDTVVRVNVFRSHRQTIQYIQPQDAFALAQAELVVIDEAAAIPLPLVRKLMGPHLVFLASTINGYEGTGRSVSLMLLQQLREQSRGFVGSQGQGQGERGAGGRALREVSLDEPIRYAAGDATERWINRLLCLDATIAPRASSTSGCPHPSSCELYWVNRDALFSYHAVSETFLQRLVGLFVASHYKNSPNDLQLLSDAPGHQVFVLLPPVDPAATSLPEPLCAIQVSLEGGIARQAVVQALGRGERSEGDLIPWLVAQQFQDDDFAALSGARVVRIATHPDYAGMGYGSRALAQLRDFYQGRFVSLGEAADPGDSAAGDAADEPGLPTMSAADLASADLSRDALHVRDPAELPPLFLRLAEKRAPRLHWLGVSYGLTQNLHRFWRRAGYTPVYLRQTANDLTGELTCVMLNELSGSEGGSSSAGAAVVAPRALWLDAFARDFHRRFSVLLSYAFGDFSVVLAMAILDAAHREPTTSASHDDASLAAYGRQDLARDFSAYDLRRLEAYANNLLDYHVVLDMLPTVAQRYFGGAFGSSLSLSGVQACILLGLGLQRKSVDAVEKELNLPSRQILALFTKVLRKFSNHFRALETAAIEQQLDAAAVQQQPAAAAAAEHGSTATGGSAKRSIDDDAAWDPTGQSLEDELRAAGREVTDEFRAKQREMIDALDLSQFAIAGDEADWQKAEKQIEKARGASGTGVSSVVSVANPESSKRMRKERKDVVGGLKKAEDARKHKAAKKTKTSKKTGRF
ncbi:N-acetyltransferase 10 [Coemansia erecta]|uniref:RNA cytidine acetyltransferase n=1 Tax=Coemansia erecta TaxID=147472 RepID=A0A9W7XYW6_9FUNG|nr:N-acetyltransferase 10 [Coemansia erecta]